MDKPWSKNDIAYLKRHADSYSLDELARHFETDIDAVKKKVGQLGLETASGDPSLDAFTKGVELLGKKDPDGAAALFEKVVEESDGRRLRDRARQYLAICRSHNETPAETEDPFLAAVVAKNEGSLEEADRLCGQGPSDEERFIYLNASIRALSGENEKALELLKKAIALEPKNRVHAFHDPDFETLRGSEGFNALINPPKAEAS